MKHMDIKREEGESQAREWWERGGGKRKKGEGVNVIRGLSDFH